MSLNLCGSVGGNSGTIPCDRSRSIPKKLFAGGKVFVAAEYATPDAFQAALKAACKLPMGNNSKLFPFPEIGGTTDKTDALKEATLGYGLKQVTIEGRPGYEYQVQMGQTTFQNLRAFNRAIVPVFTVDDQNSGWGTYHSDTTFTGEMAQLFISGMGFGDGTKPLGVATISIAYQSASDFNDYSKYVPINFSVNDAKGLNNVVLTEYAAHASNVYHIAPAILTAQLGKVIPLEQDYAVALASAALWLPTVAGVALAVTSVVDAPGLGFTVTLDTTAYAALPTGAVISMQLAGSVALDNANVTGVEQVAPLLLIK